MPSVVKDGSQHVCSNTGRRSSASARSPLAELRFGAEARRSRKLHGLISTFVEAVAVAPFDQPAADRFAAVAASLARRGEPIGTFDTLIAAHALSLGATFVTNNAKHFERVVGLKTENWV